MSVRDKSDITICPCLITYHPGYAASRSVVHSRKVWITSPSPSLGIQNFDLKMQVMYQELHQTPPPQALIDSQQPINRATTLLRDIALARLLRSVTRPIKSCACNTSFLCAFLIGIFTILAIFYSFLCFLFYFFGFLCFLLRFHQFSFGALFNKCLYFYIHQEHFIYIVNILKYMINILSNICLDVYFSHTHYTFSYTSKYIFIHV